MWFYNPVFIAQSLCFVEPLPVEELNVTSGDPYTLNVEWSTPDPAQQHHFNVTTAYCLEFLPWFTSYFLFKKIFFAYYMDYFF